MNVHPSRWFLLKALLFIVLISFTNSTCSWTRSRHATNVEDDIEDEVIEEREGWTAAKVASDTDGSPQDYARSARVLYPHLPPLKPHELPPQRIHSATDDDKAAELFNQALKEQEEAAYTRASELWKTYVGLYAATPDFERAQYNLALSLFHLGRTKEAYDPLKNILHSPKDGLLAVEARLLLAECLLRDRKPDEALALTYEIFPSARAEKQVGLKRFRNAVGTEASKVKPTLPQEVRLLVLRARVFASLKDQVRATEALNQAQNRINQLSKLESTGSELKTLTAHWAWRSIEVLAFRCEQKFPAPERLSEAEFLAYAQGYYGCVSSSKRLYCKVVEAKDEQIRTQAVRTYRALAEAPLRLRNPLPPPARRVQKPEQRAYYEREMTGLIEKTVADHIREYRNLDACGAYEIF
ncbi:MAG: CDC27 family protein [Bdellovibrionota bacterium]